MAMLTISAVLLCSSSPSSSSSAASPTAAKKPNIVFLLTDDQDTRLGSFVAMPKTTQFIAGEGANISNFFIHTPICCPSRTTFLSGNYVHNNRVNTNTDGGCMRMNTSRDARPDYWADSFVPILKDTHGYTTGLFGKVLNDMSTYGCKQGYQSLPPGVDRLMIMCNVAYVDVNWADFATNSSLDSKQAVHNLPNYTTSVVGNESLAWIESVISSGPDHPPFFAYMGPHAPHLPSTPAPWYQDHPVGNTPVPKEVYYNYSAVGKHSFGNWSSLADEEPVISAEDAQAIALEHSNRLKTLLSVDDIIGDLHALLVRTGEWDDTYVLTCSDHGYSLGQFRVDSHKTQVWDHNTRVPVFIKGPGIKPGSIFPGIVSMADLAPTMLELAAGGNDPSAAPGTMDGESFAPLITNQAQIPWKNAALIEYQSIRDTVSIGSPEYISAYGYRVESGTGAVQFHAHDGPNNTFAAIRIINTTATPAVELLYAECFDVLDPDAWHFEPEKVLYHELYDVTTDYYMLNNIYPAAEQALKDELHAKLQALVHCRGSTCRELLR